AVSRCAYEYVDLDFFDREVGHLPDQQFVAYLHETLAVETVFVFRFTYQVIDVLTGQILHQLALLDLRHQVQLALLPFGASQEQAEAGLRSERVEHIDQLPQIFAHRLEASDRENLIAGLEALLFGVAAGFDRADEDLVAERLHLPPILGAVGAARGQKEGVRIVEVDQRLRDDPEYLPY